MKKIAKGFKRYLHKLARIVEKYSPLKGELVEIEFIKEGDEIKYIYSKVRDKN